MPTCRAMRAGLGLGYFSYRRPRAALGLAGTVAATIAPVVYFQASEMCRWQTAAGAIMAAGRRLDELEDQGY